MPTDTEHAPAAGPQPPPQAGLLPIVVSLTRNFLARSKK